VFNNVLVAVDLIMEPARFVLDKTREFVDADATIHVIHVVEPQYVQYSFDPTFTGSLTRSLERDALEGAAQRVAEICEPYAIPSELQHVILGRAADRIHEAATEHGCQAIIIGSHSQHGWRRLLGSTANAVLHGAPVDVVVVRIPKDAG